MQYTVGFIAGMVAMYLALKPQLKEFDQVLKEINERLGERDEATQEANS